MGGVLALLGLEGGVVDVVGAAAAPLGRVLVMEDFVVDEEMQHIF